MSDVNVSVEMVEEILPAELSADLLDDQLIGKLVDRARSSFERRRETAASATQHG
jgi:putative transposase